MVAIRHNCLTKRKLFKELPKKTTTNKQRVKVQNDIHIMPTYYSFDMYTSATGTNVNTANQTSDILRYPMNNTFIMYCSYLNTIVTSFLCNKHLLYIYIYIYIHTLFIA